MNQWQTPAKRAFLLVRGPHSTASATGGTTATNMALVTIHTTLTIQNIHRRQLQWLSVIIHSPHEALELPSHCTVNKHWSCPFWLGSRPDYTQVQVFSFKLNSCLLDRGWLWNVLSCKRLVLSVTNLNFSLPLQIVFINKQKDFAYMWNHVTLPLNCFGRGYNWIYPIPICPKTLNALQPLIN